MRWLVKKLEFGKNTILNIPGKWSIRTPETRVALGLWQQIQLMQDVEDSIPKPKKRPRTSFSHEIFRKLGDLHKSNVKEWWKAIEPLFLKTYGNNFENNKLFSHYWRNAAYTGQKNAGALIRRDIKKKILQSFSSIAPR